MTHVGRVSILTLLVGCFAASVHAQVSTFEELRFRVQPGVTVTVETTDGQRAQGSLLQMAPDRVVLAGARGEPRTWMREAIQRLSVKQQDPLSNGALVGAIVGATAGAIPQFSESCRHSPGCGIGWVASSLGGALVGALSIGCTSRTRSSTRAAAWMPRSAPVRAAPRSKCGTSGSRRVRAHARPAIERRRLFHSLAGQLQNSAPCVSPAHRHRPASAHPVASARL